MRLFFLFLAACVLPCQAQQPTAVAVKGCFYTSVDDTVTVYINGKKAFSEKQFGEHRSAEMELKVGDRVLFRLANAGGNHRFMVLFATSDNKSIVSFRDSDFRAIPDLDIEDFDPTLFPKWKIAKREAHKGGLQIRSYSDWVWGYDPHCFLGAVITPRMFSTRMN